MYTWKKLVPVIAEEHRITNQQAAAIINSIQELMVESLLKNEKFSIADFGTFAVKKRKAKLCRNPQNGDKIEIPARQAVTFKASTVLLQRVQK